MEVKTQLKLLKCRIETYLKGFGMWWVGEVGDESDMSTFLAWVVGQSTTTKQRSLGQKMMHSV